VQPRAHRAAQQRQLFVGEGRIKAQHYGLRRFGAHRIAGLAKLRLQAGRANEQHLLGKAVLGQIQQRCVGRRKYVPFGNIRAKAPQARHIVRLAARGIVC
jgi:hypothetical protein